MQGGFLFGESCQVSTVSKCASRWMNDDKRRLLLCKMNSSKTPRECWRIIIQICVVRPEYKYYYLLNKYLKNFVTLARRFWESILHRSFAFYHKQFADSGKRNAHFFLCWSKEYLHVSQALIQLVCVTTEYVRYWMFTSVLKSVFLGENRKLQTTFVLTTTYVMLTQNQFLRTIKWFSSTL